MPQYLTDFSILRPQFEVPQEFSLEWISAAHAKAEAKKHGEEFDERKFQEGLLEVLMRIGAGPTKVQSRGIQHPDFTHLDWKKNDLFSEAKNPCFGKRTSVFDEVVEKVFEDFYPPEVKLPEELIHVSCTGYVSPSGAQKIVAKRKSGAFTTVTHAYHMGCYAAIPALRMAKGFSLSGKAKVDIVHTEMCTLHMNPDVHSLEQLIVQTLFADGFCKYSLTPAPKERCFELEGIKEVILSDTLHAMSWQTDHWGLKMGLKAEVPHLIASKLKSVIQEMLPKSSCLFAIHPGGPKIIEKVASTLELQESQIAHSKEIFYRFGNMSSATLPHIWQNMLQDEKVEAGTPVVSLAFGPGLTVAAAVLIKR